MYYALAYKDTGLLFSTYWTEVMVEGFGGSDEVDDLFEIYAIEQKYNRHNIYATKTAAEEGKKLLLREARGNGFWADLAESDIRIVRIEE